MDEEAFRELSMGGSPRALQAAQQGYTGNRFTLILQHLSRLLFQHDSNIKPSTLPNLVCSFSESRAWVAPMLLGKHSWTRP